MEKKTFEKLYPAYKYQDIKKKIKNFEQSIKMFEELQRSIRYTQERSN